MSELLDDRRLNFLYHALGAGDEAGVRDFDESFRQAEAGFRIEELNRLLDLLIDPTLPDRRLLSWHQYCRARRALLLNRLEEAWQLLQHVSITDERDRRCLLPRVELLRGKIQFQQGKWSASRATLGPVIKQLQHLEDPALCVEAYVALAQSYISQAHNCGNWTVRPGGKASRILHNILTFALWPLYLPLLAFLWLSRLGHFVGPALRFGSDFSNWPIFAYYLRAYRALVPAWKMSDKVDERRRFHLRMVRAGLLRDLNAYTAAKQAYETLKNASQAPPDSYEQALILHGLAQTALAVGGTASNIEARQRLEAAQATYLRLEDERAAAYADLLLGQFDLVQGDAGSALSRWASAIKALQAQNDQSGLADALGYCYGAIDAGLPPALQAQAVDVVRSVKRQVFSVRLQSRTFALIQVLGWLVPLLAVVALAGRAAAYVETADVGDYTALLKSAFTFGGLAALAAILLAAMLIRTLVGMAGLLACVWTESTRLDYFEVNEQGISRYDYLGSQKRSLAWAAVDAHLRVERSLLWRPSRVLSFDCLRSQDGQVLRLPGTTSWFPHLRQAVEQHLEEPARVHRLQVRGGIVLLCVGLGFALTLLLTDAGLGPQISIRAYAWAATTSGLLSYLLLAAVTGRWCLHYARVSAEITPRPRFPAGTLLLGLVLLLVGALGRRPLLPAVPLLVTWGTIFLAYATPYLFPRAPARQRTVAARAIQGMSLVTGALLILVTLVPLVQRVQGFTYQNALYRLDEHSTQDRIVRDRLFQQLCSVVDWMPQLDPIHFEYQGHCAYFHGDPGASQEAYTKAMVEPHMRADLYYCRALAYLALGQTGDAERDMEAYWAQCCRERRGEEACAGLDPQAQKELCRDCWDEDACTDKDVKELEEVQTRCYDCGPPICLRYFPDAVQPADP